MSSREQRASLPEMDNRRGTANIRSPLVKRDQQSQVVLKGWLFKLEGGALKQWKKRWFVLADFCLFYYKDPEEEKLQGSILLPSYRINPCSNEDRISKKFAFKAEHQNMKTYFFASESKESMVHWMNAMCLATIMQKDCRVSNVLADRSYGSPVVLDDEDSGFTSYRSRRSAPSDNNSALNNSISSDHLSSTPSKHHNPQGGHLSDSLIRSGRAPVNNGYLGSDQKYPVPYNRGHQEVPARRHGQPVYANAPPKPKRIPPMDQQIHDHSSSFEQIRGFHGDGYPHQSPASINSDYNQETCASIPFDGTAIPFEGTAIPFEGTAGQYNQEWPEGMPYQDNYVYGSGFYPLSKEKNQNISHKQPPRPHSADFLDRETNPSEYPLPTQSSRKYTQPKPRPKSSLEKYDPEQYWEPQKTDNTSDNVHNMQFRPDYLRMTQGEEWSQQQMHSSYPNPAHEYLYSNAPENNYPPRARSHSSSSSQDFIPYTIHRSQPNLKVHDESPIVAEVMLKSYEQGRHYDYDVESAIPNVVMRESPRGRTVRSASAEYHSELIPAYHYHYHNTPQHLSDNPDQPRDQKKIQMREESMRRLLEWKQRMLQSPLTKKYSPKPGLEHGSPSHSIRSVHSSAGGSVNLSGSLDNVPSSPTIQPVRPPLPKEYHQKVLQDLENHEAKLRMSDNVLGQHDNRKYLDANNRREQSRINSDNIENSPPSGPINLVPQEPRKQSLYQNGISSSPVADYPEMFRDQPTFTPCKHSPEKSQNTTKSQEHTKSLSSLNRLQQSYSSDDEGSFAESYRSEGKITSHRKKLRLSGLNASDSEINKQTSSKIRRLIQKSQGLSRQGKRLSISAGDLLEKSHEELVLLLIQLRRSQGRVLKARQKCHLQLENSEQHCRLTADTNEYLQNIDDLQNQIQELDRQYDMTQPLVNLVDNMVKLGSLYRGHEKKTVTSAAMLFGTIGMEKYCPSKSLSDFTRQLRLHHEKLEGPGSFGNDTFKDCMQQLYNQNHEFRSESLNLTSLHQDKDMLEYTLDSVKGKVSGAGENLMVVQKLKRQQQMLEKELNRVRNLLAQSAARLEDYAVEIAQLEKRLMNLKHRVQQALKNTSFEKTQAPRLSLDSELSHVQSVIEELAKQRQELVAAIETLKAESKQRKALIGLPIRASATGVAGSASLPVRKKIHTTYLETDLDTMTTRDLALVSKRLYSGSEDNPLYVNTTEINSITEHTLGKLDLMSAMPAFDYSHDSDAFEELYSPQDISDADDRVKRFYGILPREKSAEIKTVRIVKRESERRNRVRGDKKKVSYDENSVVWLVDDEGNNIQSDHEEEEEADNDAVFSGNQSYLNRPTSLCLLPQQQQGKFLSARQQLFGQPQTAISPSSTSSDQLPVTPQAVLAPSLSQETNTSNTNTSSEYWAPFKKAKRRHYTISGSQPSLENSSPKLPSVRSRDDMDMERCLRTVNTPDIVRSTIKKTDIFDEKLIERELALPQKIVIPERYIEVEPEELSPSEKLRRSMKAETIRKMLSETTTTYEDIGDKGPKDRIKEKLSEEKKRRAHLLVLNHALAKEVMERSKMVAATRSSPEPPPSC